jgi:hypothetical protein
MKNDLYIINKNNNEFLFLIYGFKRITIIIIQNEIKEQKIILIKIKVQ